MITNCEFPGFGNTLASSRSRHNNNSSKTAGTNKKYKLRQRFPGKTMYQARS